MTQATHILMDRAEEFRTLVSAPGRQDGSVAISCLLNHPCLYVGLLPSHLVPLWPRQEALRGCVHWNKCALCFGALCTGLWLVGTWVTTQKEQAQMCYNALPTSADPTKQAPSALNDQCICQSHSQQERGPAGGCMLFSVPGHKSPS